MKGNSIGIREGPIVLGIMLATAAVLLSDILFPGIIPTILRGVIGFVYLSLIPGVLLGRILKLSKNDLATDFLFTVGLSLSFTMVFGALTNSLLPLSGISKPFSEIPVIIGLFSVNSAMYVVGHRFRLFRYYRLNLRLPESGVVNSGLYLFLIVLLSILAVYLLNSYNTNVLSLIVILLIASVPFLAVSGKLPPSLFPVAIFVIAASLLYQHSLVSMYLVGGDSMSEAYRAKAVLLNSRWDMSVAESANAVLTITTLTPALSILCGLEVIWVFKAVFPFFFALIPPGLYLAFRRQFGSEQAFLAAFFFTVIPAFFLALPGLMKQGTAELFLMLLLTLLGTGKPGDLKSRVLLMIFTASLITAHYATSYFIMLVLAIAYLLALGNKKLGIKLGGEGGTGLLGWNFICLFAVFTIAWYMYTAGAYNFVRLTLVGSHIMENLGEFFNPTGSQPLRLLTGQARTWQMEIARLVNVTMQVLVVIGVIRHIFKKEKGVLYEHSVLAISCLIIWVMSLGLVGFSYSGSIDAQRVYGFTLLFLAPFGIRGAAWLVELFKKALSALWGSRLRLGLKPNGVVTGLLLLLFISNVGFLDATTHSKEPILAWPLLLPRYSASTPLVKGRLAGAYVKEQDAAGLRWLSDNRSPEVDAVADWASVYQNYGIPGPRINVNIGAITPETPLPRDTYIFLRGFNVAEGQMLRYSGDPPRTDMFSTGEVTALFGSAIVYSNGGSEIHYYAAK